MGFKFCDISGCELLGCFISTAFSGISWAFLRKRDSDMDQIRRNDDNKTSFSKLQELKAFSDISSTWIGDNCA